MEGRKGVGHGSGKKRKDYFMQDYLPLEEGKGSIMQITSPVLIRKFQIDWFKIPLLGEAEIAVRLGTTFWFADLRLSTSDSTLSLFFLFLTLGILSLLSGK